MQQAGFWAQAATERVGLSDKVDAVKTGTTMQADATTEIVVSMAANGVVRPRGLSGRKSAGTTGMAVLVLEQSGVPMRREDIVAEFKVRSADRHARHLAKGSTSRRVSARTPRPVVAASIRLTRRRRPARVDRR